MWLLIGLTYWPSWLESLLELRGNSVVMRKLVTVRLGYCVKICARIAFKNAAYMFCGIRYVSMRSGHDGSVCVVDFASRCGFKLTYTHMQSADHTKTNLLHGVTRPKSLPRVSHCCRSRCVKTLECMSFVENLVISTVIPFLTVVSWFNWVTLTTFRSTWYQDLRLPFTCTDCNLCVMCHKMFTHRCDVSDVKQCRKRR